MADAAAALAGVGCRFPFYIADREGMPMHELTTNALEYGTLRTFYGQLYVNWYIHIGEGGDRTLDLLCQERDVPVVSVRPSREGFGREPIEVASPCRIRAGTRIDVEGGGVRCSITPPLTDRSAGPAAGGDAR